MKMQEKKQVVILSTEKVSKIGDIVSNDDRLLAMVIPYKYGKNMTTEGAGSDKMKVQHLYILSDEEIKEGDWYVLIQYKNKGYQLSTQPCRSNEVQLQYKFNCKKIIATTNPELKFTDYRISPVPNFMELPKISQDFIKAYIKAYNEGNTIKEVMVEYEEYHGINTSLTEISSYNNDAKDYGKDYKLRLRPDNTIIVNRIKEKRYSREILENICYDCYKEGLTIGTNNLNPNNFKEWFNKNCPE